MDTKTRLKLLKTVITSRARLEDLERKAFEIRADRGAMIRHLQENGVGLQEIADVCGVAKQTVHKWSQAPTLLELQP
jgi:DNA-directed RNA polymerase specialized sigma24 family protein